MRERRRLELAARHVLERQAKFEEARERLFAEGEAVKREVGKLRVERGSRLLGPTRSADIQRELAQCEARLGETELSLQETVHSLGEMRRQNVDQVFNIF
jgi:hypothetical protein